MITYDPKAKTVHMSLADLEHCGFDCDQYNEQLFMAGLDSNDLDIVSPDNLVVHFAGFEVIIGDEVSKDEWFVKLAKDLHGYLHHEGIFGECVNDMCVQAVKLKLENRRMKRG